MLSLYGLCLLATVGVYKLFTLPSLQNNVVGEKSVAMMYAKSTRSQEVVQEAEGLCPPPSPPSHRFDQWTTVQQLPLCFSNAAQYVNFAPPNNNRSAVGNGVELCFYGLTNQYSFKPAANIADFRFASSFLAYAVENDQSAAVPYSIDPSTGDAAECPNGRIENASTVFSVEAVCPFNSQGSQYTDIQAAVYYNNTEATNYVIIDNNSPIPVTRGDAGIAASDSVVNEACVVTKDGWLSVYGLGSQGETVEYSVFLSNSFGWSCKVIPGDNDTGTVILAFTNNSCLPQFRTYQFLKDRSGIQLGRKWHVDNISLPGTCPPPFSCVSGACDAQQGCDAQIIDATVDATFSFLYIFIQNGLDGGNELGNGYYVNVYPLYGQSPILDHLFIGPNNYDGLYPALPNPELGLENASGFEPYDTLIASIIYSNQPLTYPEQPLLDYALLYSVKLAIDHTTAPLKKSLDQHQQQAAVQQPQQPVVNVQPAPTLAPLSRSFISQQQQFRQPQQPIQNYHGASIGTHRQ